MTESQEGTDDCCFFSFYFSLNAPLHSFPYQEEKSAPAHFSEGRGQRYFNEGSEGQVLNKDNSNSVQVKLRTLSYQKLKKMQEFHPRLKNNKK